jgi:hypothetical protein
VQVDDVSLEPKQQFNALGIFFDVKAKTYKMESRWIGKLVKFERLFENKVDWSVRDLYELCGSLLWHAQVMKAPLCMKPHVR